MTCALQHAPKIILICAVASALHQKKIWFSIDIWYFMLLNGHGNL